MVLLLFQYNTLSYLDHKHWEPPPFSRKPPPSSFSQEPLPSFSREPPPFSRKSPPFSRKSPLLHIRELPPFFSRKPSPFKAKISTSKLFYGQSEPVTLYFELTNVSENDFYILKWSTPLEGFRNNFLRVFHNNKTLRYKGILVKRGNPILKNYVFVPAGGSVKASLVLNEAYDFSQTGVYVLKLVTFIMDAQQVSSITDFVPSTLDKFHGLPLKTGPIVVVVL